EPYLSLSLYRPGQPVRYLKRPLACGSISRQGEYLRVAGGLVSETADHLCLNIPFANEGHLQGQINKLSAPLAIADGILYQDRANNLSSYWLVPVPHATFQATLTLDGSVTPLSGVAYHDHQWGNVPLQAFVSDWVWGHLSNAQRSLVFFHLLTQTGAWVSRVGLVEKNGRYTATSLQTDYAHQLMDYSQPDQFDNRPTVQLFNQLISVTFPVSPSQLMRQRVGEQHPGFSSSYLRWATTAHYQAGQQSETLYGITEYIRIRPERYEQLPP
ncbi:MAG: hypothetical protein KDE56_24125, partial [Anaerolineales bacterium]|nr:hypothetical protein [Anaerolineales bacterium]